MFQEDRGARLQHGRVRSSIPHNPCSFLLASRRITKEDDGTVREEIME